MNFVESKIKALEDEKNNNKKLIAEREQDITEKDQEIKRLEILTERLSKISTIKNYENLVDSQRITILSNRVTLGDLLASLSDCVDVRCQFSEGNMRLSSLTIRQILYLLFDDRDEPKRAPIENPGAVDPENVSLDLTKKFLNRGDTQG